MKNPKDWSHHSYLDTILHTEHTVFRRVQKNYYVTDTIHQEEEEDVQVDDEEEEEEEQFDDEANLAQASEEDR